MDILKGRNLNKLVLKIINFHIELSIDSQSILDEIEKDFSYFKDSNLDKITDFNLRINCSLVDKYNLPSGLIAKKQSQNSITYDVGNIRYNDYYGEALTQIDYKKNIVEMVYKNESLAHEILYLVILSRTTKFLDGLGYHKIHASAFTYSNFNILFMMPSKGGKSTMLLEMLRNPEVGLISDDTPVVNRKGEIIPFPLRLGNDDRNKVINFFPYLRDEDISLFKRKYYSDKYLVDIKKIKNKIQTKDKTILIAGYRSTNIEPKIELISKMKMLSELKTHLIVGIGLPMVIEYFIENTLNDHFKNLRILFSRFFTAIILVQKSECYRIALSSNPVENCHAIKRLLDEK